VETLFRLVLTRPAISQREDMPSIALQQASPFQVELTRAGETSTPREGLRRVARQFVGGQEFVGAPASLPLTDRLEKLAISLDNLERIANPPRADIVKAITDAFGQAPIDLVNGNVLAPLMARLRDSILAIKLLPEEHGRDIAGLTRQLRDLETILKIASDQRFPDSGATLRRYRRRSVLLPLTGALTPTTSTADRQKKWQKQRDEAEAKRRAGAEEKVRSYRQLEAAVAELGNLASEHFQSSPSTTHTGFLVPSAFRPSQLAMQELMRRQQLSQVETLRLRTTVERSVTTEIGGQGISEHFGLTLAPPNARLLLAGSPRFVAGGELGLRVKPGVENSLSAATREALQKRHLSLADRPTDRIVEILQVEMRSLARDLDELYGGDVRRTFKRVGGLLVMTTTSLPTAWNTPLPGPLPGPLPPPLPSIPSTHGNVQPAGVADLLVIKQQLVRYEAADVAHIETVLKGERKEREHMQRRETETFTLRESETTTTDERDLESTSRFEMSRETSQTINEDMSLKAGLTVSGKYGPTVDYSASAEGSVSRTKEEATKTAAKFSQDVTERSSHKATERILERATLRVTDEVVEENNHLLDNTLPGAANIAGVYQWVNKVYQAQMFNYGLRTLYEFMIPEPAAFLISALQSAHAEAVSLEMPIPFTLRPDLVTESNFNDWVVRYGATGIAPPPEIYKTKSLDFKAGGGDSDTDYNHSAQVQIDEGYRAILGTVTCVLDIWDDSYSVDLALGSRSHRQNDGTGWSWSTALNDERDSIPFALDTFHVSQVAAAVEVMCQRTDRAMQKWRLETHGKLTEAYTARLSEYEEKLSNLQMQAGIAIQGRNPASNLQVINDELKKNCVSVMTQQHYDLFSAIETGANGLPEIDLAEAWAEGPYVRFFEQAFEWEHMTWLAYPYFWGRKSEWESRIAFDDTDPLFTQFLKAGYCRVVVPARPSFEGAIDHFMTLGEIWNGGPLPTISSPLYLPIADELAERLDRPGGEVAQGDPWLVRVPTTLVNLRDDDRLPAWEQQPDGSWAPV
jgi:hypothetical protein